MEYEKLIADVIEEVQNQLLIKKTSKKPLLMIGSDTDCDGLEDVFDILPIETSIKEQNENSILITHLPLTLMGNIACGCGTDEQSECVLRALIKGISVFVLEKALIYRQYKYAANKSLYRLYSEYENRILQMGIQIISSPRDILDSLPEAPGIYKDRKGPEADFTDKKLLLESDMLKCHIKEQTIIRILNSCIITPLAEDFIKYHKLILKRI